MISLDHFREKAMNQVRLIPVILSALMLSVHFSRGGDIVLSTCCMLIPLLLLIRKTWVPHLLEVFLVLGSLEWLHRIYEIFKLGGETGEPWLEAAVKLLMVALFTAASSLVFQISAIRERYGLPPRVAPDDS